MVVDRCGKPRRRSCRGMATKCRLWRCRSRWRLRRRTRRRFCGCGAGSRVCVRPLTHSPPRRQVGTEDDPGSASLRRVLRLHGLTDRETTGGLRRTGSARRAGTPNMTPSTATCRLCQPTPRAAPARRRPPVGPCCNRQCVRTSGRSRTLWWIFRPCVCRRSGGRSPSAAPGP
jgi:hypothetical protein